MSTSTAKPQAPAATQTLELGPLHHSSPASNRRASSSGSAQRSYPWLLLASTGLAAVFCGLYLTKPVIAAGTAPSIADAPFEPAPSLSPGADAAPPPAPEPEGVTVTVEPGSGGAAAVDAAAVKLLAPFPAKPLAAPPVGWRLEHPKEVPAFVREVPLSNGTKISLSIRPHLLVPDADGANVIAVKEPGYEPALRYAQTGTMSAVISSSLERLDQDSRKMSEAIDRLGQLLSSLPSPEAPPESAPSPVKKPR